MPELRIVDASSFIVVMQWYPQIVKAITVRNLPAHVARDAGSRNCLLQAHPSAGRVRRHPCEMRMAYSAWPSFRAGRIRRDIGAWELVAHRLGARAGINVPHTRALRRLTALTSPSPQEDSIVPRRVGDERRHAG